MSFQALEEPIDIEFPGLGDDESAGSFRLTRTSRPIQIARIPIGKQTISVINLHLKSKLGEFVRPTDAAFAPEQDLPNYDALGRAIGEARASMRRMAEAAVVRKLALGELRRNRPVMVLGDYNDGEHAVSSAIIAGEKPFKNYAWMLRHDAKHRNDRYSRDEDALIRSQVEETRLHSAEALFVRKSLRDMVYTSAFGGVYESIDQILMSHHFLPESPGSIGEMEYLSALNDHLTDGAHPEAPYNKLASDHGQLIAHIRLDD